ncbi:MAG: glycosyltransferase family 2 protein [Gemmatimonadales bacterium]|nr:MAG: glycosyltransferase family 2 protein [Gemmatimonadales bacterium]
MIRDQITAVICAHNPRPDYFVRVLDALRCQTLPHGQWGLLVVDNASEADLRPDVQWHSQARCIREETLGLTVARLRAIRETGSELIVFVDDDALIAPDYLERALRISRDWPKLGVWGGRLLPEFEREPPAWTREFWPLLALRQFDADYWSNMDVPLDMLPCGAGICVRRAVAIAYAESVSHDPVRLGLDRKGTSLMSAGDSDLALTAGDVGLGIGMFRDLSVSHLIPPSRLTEDYLLNLAESIHYSSTILLGRRNRLTSIKTPGRWRWWCGMIRRRLTMAARPRRFVEAKMRGRQRAIREVASWRNGTAPSCV